MNPEQSQPAGEEPTPSGPVDSHILAQAEKERRPTFDPTGRVEEINKTEVKIADVRRHPFGLIVVYLQAIVGIGIALGLMLPFLPEAFESIGLSRSTAVAFGSLFTLVVVVFIIIYLILATRIYRANQLIITGDNVTQVLQVGLFHRKVSEISMGNVEDVSAHQENIFQTIFNFGRVHIETAGEQNNYDFHYCPNPNAYAKAIQDARLEFIKTHGD